VLPAATIDMLENGFWFILGSGPNGTSLPATNQVEKQQ
jgi:hypothetical protein